MRITLDIDDDILLAATERAKREPKTAGRVISELLRLALTAPMPDASTGCEEPALHGFRPFPPRGGVVSNDMINKLRDGDLY